MVPLCYFTGAFCFTPIPNFIYPVFVLLFQSRFRMRYPVSIITNSPVKPGVC